MILTLKNNHAIVSDTKTLGLDNENKSEFIDILVEDETLFDKWAYIEFSFPKGTKFLTPRLDIIDGKIHYVVPNSLMITGYLLIQVVFRDATDWIWKSFVFQTTVKPSINAVNEVEREHPDFINEAQKVLDYFYDQSALIDTKVDKTTKINGYTLDRDVELDSEDIGTYSKEEIDNKFITNSEIDALFI